VLAELAVVALAVETGVDAFPVVFPVRPVGVAPAPEGVVAEPAAEVVGAGLAVQVVGAAESAQVVVPRAAPEDVRRLVAIEGVSWALLLPWMPSTSAWM
jgi:hypothetical protein